MVYVWCYTTLKCFICLMRCLNHLFNIEDRQRGRLAEFSLYVSNSSLSTNTDIKSTTVCYKDGPHLPAINFTTTCIKEGCYVIFYNERLNEVTYPEGNEISNDFSELCEVIVKGIAFQFNQYTFSVASLCSIISPSRSVVFQKSYSSYLTS